MSKRAPEEKLLIGVLAQMIQDFMSAREITDFGFKRMAKKRRLSRARLAFVMNYRAEQLQAMLQQGPLDLSKYLRLLNSYMRLRQAISSSKRKQKMLSIGQAAYIYIFEDSWESENYVFGFVFACRYLGLDPIRMRQRIHELKQSQIKGIRKIATKRGKKP